MDIKVGDEIPPGDPVLETLSTGKIFSGIMPKEFFGVPIKGGTYSLHDRMGQIIGAVTIARSLDHQYKIETASENILTLLKQTNASVEEIAAGLQKLAFTIENILKLTEKNNQKIKETDSIISLK